MGGKLRFAGLCGAVSLVGALLTGCDNIVPPTHPNVSTEVAPPPATQASWPQVPDSEPRAADVYWPAEYSAANPPSDLPVLVWTRGGWGGDENPFDPRHYNDLGFVVVAIRYSGIDGAVDTPGDDDAEWAAQAQDVDTGIRWLRAYHDRIGIDPDRIVMLGESAGAHLATSITTGDFGPDPSLPAEMQSASPRPDGLMLVNGPYELSRKTDFDRTNPADPSTSQDSGLAHVLIKDLLECDPWDGPADPSPTTDPDNLPLCAPAVVNSASPITHTATLAQFPRTLLYAARDDEVVGVDQGIRFSYALCVSGVELHWYLPDTGRHGATTLPQRTKDLFLREWNSNIPPLGPGETVLPSPNGVCNA